MDERSLTLEDLRAGLQDIRLPPDAPGGLAAELVVAGGTGLLLALLLSGLLPLMTRRVERKKPHSLKDQIKALTDLPEETRRIELLRLLKSIRPGAPLLSRHDLYATDGLPTIEELETELNRTTAHA